MTSFYNKEDSATPEELPGSLLELSFAAIEIEEFWTFHFNGATTATFDGVGIDLTTLEGHTTTISHQLTFPCTNNMAEYKSFVMKLATAIRATK